jgi:FkbM family methyltransferase
MTIACHHDHTFDADAIQPGEWAMDVGARNFDISKFLARRGVNSIAVEADPSLASLNNLHDIRHPEIDLIRVRLGLACVGSKDRQPRMPLDTSGNIYAFSLYTAGEKAVMIDTTTVPMLMAEYGVEQLSLLKLDCEGAEYGILRDVIEAGLAGKPLARQVSVEYHHHCGIFPPGVKDPSDFPAYLLAVAFAMGQAGYRTARGDPMDALYILDRV